MDDLAPPPAEQSASPPTSPRAAPAQDLDVHQIPVLEGETSVKLSINGFGISIKPGFEPIPVAHTAAPVASHAAPPARARPTTRRVDPMRASCPAAFSKPAASPSDVPSYLRSTAAAQARVKNAPETIVVREWNLPKQA